MNMNIYGEMFKIFSYLLTKNVQLSYKSKTIIHKESKVMIKLKYIIHINIVLYVQLVELVKIFM